MPLRIYKHVCPVHLDGIPSTDDSRHVLQTMYQALPGKLTLWQHYSNKNGNNNNNNNNVNNNNSSNDNNNNNKIAFQLMMS